VQIKPESHRPLAHLECASLLGTFGNLEGDGDLLRLGLFASRTSIRGTDDATVTLTVRGNQVRNAATLSSVASPEPIG
jgi:hypothetical protein